jgi:hypothetical protein
MRNILDSKGRVIGIVYRGPKKDIDTTMSEAQVRNRLTIYLDRYASGNKSQNVIDAIDFWTAALNRFMPDHPVEAVEV